jgi:hypothetical protein
VPGTPIALSRPPQASPVVQVPLLPVPQQGWLAPPQVPHWSVVGVTRQESPAPHGVLPPSPLPPVFGQQSCPVAPQAPQVPGIPIALSRPPQASPAEQVPLLPVPQQG